MKEKIDQYFLALENSDLSAILALFTPDAQIYSPLYGVMPPKEFYTGLLHDTHRSTITIHDVLFGESTIAPYFDYEWVLSNGEKVKFTCVDIFKLNKEQTRFESLTILYDTHPLRHSFARLQKG